MMIVVDSSFFAFPSFFSYLDYCSSGCKGLWSSERNVGRKKKRRSFPVTEHGVDFSNPTLDLGMQVYLLFEECIQKYI